MVYKYQTIPVVDLYDFTSGNSNYRNQFIETLGEGLGEIGFFAVENHEIDHALIDKAYSIVRYFFEQSDEVKKKYKIDGLKGQRGFTSFGTEHAKDHASPDLKEFWHVARDLAHDHPLKKVYPDNVWPEEIPQFKPVMQELYKQLDACAAKLLQATALYLDLPENTFSDMAVDGDTILRLIHYPPVSENSDPASIRSAAHEDINLITLLCESTDEGLQLLQRDGEWRPIRSLHGQIIVDAGDMLQNVTNGVIKSTTHRVVNPDNDRNRRFSMPFFVHARSEVDLSPIPKCVGRCGGEMKYQDITAGQYLEQRLKEIGLY